MFEHFAGGLELDQWLVAEDVFGDRVDEFQFVLEFDVRGCTDRLYRVQGSR